VTTIAQLWLDRVAQSPDRVAFRYPDGSGWGAVTWKQAGVRVRNIAVGLRTLGLEPEQRCAILSGTRYEWILADMGILVAAGATTTIYPSTTAEDCVFILTDSGSRYVFAENDAQVDKLASRRADLPEVKHVIRFEGTGDLRDGWVISLSELERRGAEQHQKTPEDYERVAKAVKKDSLATLIYTSGTTGRPKGVELLHDCWIFAGEGIDGLHILNPDDVQFLWLPLAHSFGKVLELAQLRIGFPTAVDGRVEKIVDNLAQVRPTFVAAVPRIFEKVHNRVIQSTQEKGNLSWSIFRWAMGVGRRVSQLREQGKRPGAWLALQHTLADKLVFGKLRERFGGRIRFFVSGSAPLARELAEFFDSAGLLILEGYGLTETSAAATVNRPDKHRFGTVGPPLPGCEIKIAEDGEILIKGRNVMRGYHNQPAATREVLDNGWLLTGDIGFLDPQGFLQITDRKKDLIKTSGGKYVAPQAIEGQLKVISPYVSQVLVHGNNRNFVSALVTLDPDAIKAWAKHHGLDGKSSDELAKDDRVKAMMQEYIDQLNKTLAKHETIKKFAILPHDFTLEAGEITPSLKVKRKVVEQKYKKVLDGFYAGALASD
jgi:long-chain acyl-CoA synthetase